MDDLIYLCDKKNNQIVIVDANNYRVVQVVPAPETINFSGKTFLPRKLVTDAKGRIYVISEGVYEGIMMFWPEDVYKRQILPVIASSLGLYLMRQTMVNVPTSLLESAKLDGAGEFTIYRKIVMPLVKPASITLIILNFRSL